MPTIRKAVFLAGGVGVTYVYESVCPYLDTRPAKAPSQLPLSSLISTLSHMHETASLPEEVHFLLTTHVKSTQTIADISGLETLLAICAAWPGVIHLSLFFSGHPSRALMDTAVPRERFEPRRMLRGDVLDMFPLRTLDAETQAATTVYYICGPPQMTEYFVGLVCAQDTVQADQVYYEKCESDDSDTVLDDAYKQPTFLSAG